MRFRDKKEEFNRTVESICLLVSLGAIFFQIWVLISAIEASFKGNHEVLFPSMIVSGLAFLAAGACALLPNMSFLKGMTEGRTNTYQKEIS